MIKRMVRYEWELDFPYKGNTDRRRNCLRLVKRLRQIICFVLSESLKVVLAHPVIAHLLF